MSEVTNAPEGGGGEAVAVLTPAADAQPASTNQDIARLMRETRERQNQPAASAEPAAAAEPVSAPQTADDDAAPPQEVPSETTEEQEPDESPPIERPRSWTKEADDAWQALPRNVQHIVAEREQARERELRRSQNEAADKLKGLTAKEQALEQARQQYESRLPALLQTMQSEQLAQFSDIKTIEDVTKLAVEDPFRFNQFQAHQMKMVSVQQEAEQARHREASEKSQKWESFAAEQDKLLVESVPELADQTKAEKLQKAALDVLQDRGFTQNELTELWTGQRDISLRDHRLQQLIIDSVRLREAKTIAPQKIVKPVPKVQRPGVASPRNSDGQRVQELRKQIANAKGNNQIRLVAELMRAQREASQ